MEKYLGENTPKLGFGLMRLPKLESGEIDIEQVKKMVDLFMEAGLTYFDTAYVYDNGRFGGPVSPGEVYPGHKAQRPGGDHSGGGPAAAVHQPGADGGRVF